MLLKRSVLPKLFSLLTENVRKKKAHWYGLQVCGV